MARLGKLPFGDWCGRWLARGGWLGAAVATATACGGHLDERLGLEPESESRVLPWRPEAPPGVRPLEQMDPGALLERVRPLRPWVHGVWPGGTATTYSLGLQLPSGAFACLSLTCLDDARAARRELAEQLSLGVAAVSGEGRCLLRVEVRDLVANSPDPEAAADLLARLDPSRVAVPSP